MIRVNIAEAKSRLSRLLRAAQAGERVIICERNREIAELRPIPAAPASARPLGPADPAFDLPDAFFDPLPPNLARGFDGHGA